MSAVKRAACDRCHGQKMRCIREPTKSSCHRCLAAGALCVYSMARKAGRPPTRQQSMKDTSGGWRPASSNRGEQRNPQQQRRRRQQQQKQQRPYSASLEGSRGPQENDSILEGTNDAQPSFEAMLLDAVTDDSETLVPLFSNSMPTIPGLGIWDDGDTSRPYDEGASHPLSTDSNHQQVDFMMDQAVVSDSPLLVTECSQPGTGTKPIEYEFIVPPIAGNVIQQLCALSVKLASHMKSLSSIDSDTANNPMPRLERLAANVIESSVEFHRILSEARSMLEALDGLDPLLSDTAMILQVLSAYIRLTQLYYALYQDMNSVLMKLSDCPSHESLPSDIFVPFPMLHIGGVSLSSYHRFQLKFVLQICVHHLGETETLLGLPADLCVSERMVQEEGILHQSTGEMAFLVRTIMRQAEKTVKGIRGVLAELSERTKGAIEV
ncbi:hypothetical protein BO85DRAFT_194900 [Aspergillus piperis CBS 112811]|uniref:Zn(2)-C6 fungal-type domain-containing protein n=1 Tax=Aspergillus piperis CBS 112811 TaxID=1448313 RepID=A0A8G1RAA7_9EURO|nr:hypothetical protein BO85DRAFT_194900 [Aspergillus piperis CBS 112811]RAH61362.1 hypothetical protein BO85DRAFT_194900 [Aspergillus piperis CBS 112811]